MFGCLINLKKKHIFFLSILKQKKRIERGITTVDIRLYTCLIIDISIVILTNIEYYFIIQVYITSNE